MVRGKSVNCFARTINTLGKLQEFLEDHPLLNTICELICKDDPQWTLSHLNELIHFSRTKLTIVAHHWLGFVSARLLSTTHTFKVIKKRAMMIFAILTDIPFDIGRFLHRSIWKSAMGGLSIGLCHPSLITALCAQAAGLDERVDKLADEVHQLQLRQDQQFAHQ
ncbi:hypothetical protein CDL12_29526 [Handroanthus impetiginosus]|uniref:Putative plant transposon protein domain-containing protein n=1 Tax=Handroanthus impetiginosus TaxID=429701 RepID=A0A2G9FY57_9LAMI|nr:hypothetical protein CDL12_29526 [Handroanthus impetiginosus]